MSRHEGVSCDSCLKGNFRGKRYKCLICYDYDLCATCYDAGATNTRHTTDHPMQCILTRMDFDLYYGGEAISIEQPQAFTCPFCGRMGFTETTLQEHVTSDHSDSSFEVVCPICAALPGGEPNHVTDDFASHLTLEHRNSRGEIDEPSGSRHVRRVPHPSRGISGARSRRAHMQFSSSTGLSSLSPGGVSGNSSSPNVGGSSARDSMDPITELLSQLSGARRATANLPQPNSQLHQLQMQLQLERQQAQATRQQMERLPRRQGQVTNGSATASTTQHASSGPSSNGTQSHYTMLLEPQPSPTNNAPTQFLLLRCTEPTLTESEQQSLESERVDRSLFVQEFILSTLSESLPPHYDWEALSGKVGQLAQTSESASSPNNDNCKENSISTLAAEASPSNSPVTNEANEKEASSTTFLNNNSGGTGFSPALNPTQHQNTAQSIRPQVSSTSTSQQNHNSSSASSSNPPSSGGRSGNSRKSSNSRGRSNGGTANSTFGSINQVMAGGIPPQQASQGGGSARSGNSNMGAAASARGGIRDGLHLGGGLGRGVFRNNAGGNNGAGGTSPPSSTRRKVPRGGQVDERNKSSEPPPPH